MLLLALETTSRRGQIALSRDGTIFDRDALPESRQASEMLASVVKDLLDRNTTTPHDLDAVAVSCGPGSFTGTRVSVTFAKMLTAFTKAKLVGVSTADVVVRRVDPTENKACVVFDARRKSIWAQPYECRNDDWHRVGEPLLIDPKRLVDHVPTDVVLIGEGVSYYSDALSDYRVHADFWPDIADVVMLASARLQRGEQDDPAGFVPTYVRPPQAVENLQSSPARDAVQGVS
ncbi:MAG: tRNA (adenosine(37)-N6)-threonylcarbamoyltransferase complex dimerization subunit type 1 TsaB [Planctomycetota bacterium]